MRAISAKISRYERLTDERPRVALSRQEAALSLGMSLDSFERHVQPELRLIRRGKLRLVPLAELERWAHESAESVFRRPRRP